MQDAQVSAASEKNPYLQIHVSKYMMWFGSVQE